MERLELLRIRSASVTLALAIGGFDISCDANLADNAYSTFHNGSVSLNDGKVAATFNFLSNLQVSYVTQDADEQMGILGAINTFLATAKSKRPNLMLENDD